VRSVFFDAAEPMRRCATARFLPACGDRHRIARDDGRAGLTVVAALLAPVPATGVDRWREQTPRSETAVGISGRRAVARDQATPRAGRTGALTRRPERPRHRAAPASSSRRSRAPPAADAAVLHVQNLAERQVERPPGGVPRAMGRRSRRGPGTDSWNACRRGGSAADHLSV
jgi:hypothetical protein